jgi:hypothetical protein
LIELRQKIKDDKVANKYIDEITAILNNKEHFKMDMDIAMMSLYPENDVYFSQKLSKYDKNSDEYKIYKDIYSSSNRITRLLYISPINNEEEISRGLAHYTRKITAEKLLIKKKKSISPFDFSSTQNSAFISNDSTEKVKIRLEKEKNEEDASPFRLSSILTSNDPAEGTIAFEYFGLKNEEKYNDYQEFIACFIFDPECLNQFRLYGKDQGKEATGVSLVFSKDFFAEKPAGMAQSIASKIDYNETKQGTKEKYELYRCVYIDPETKQIMALGHKDDYTFLSRQVR